MGGTLVGLSELVELSNWDPPLSVHNGGVSCTKSQTKAGTRHRIILHVSTDGFTPMSCDGGGMDLSGSRAGTRENAGKKSERYVSVPVSFYACNRDGWFIPKTTSSRVSVLSQEEKSVLRRLSYAGPRAGS